MGQRSRTTKSSEPAPTPEASLNGVIEQMGAQQRVERMAIIANALVEIVRTHNGEMDASEARRLAATSLGIAQDQVRYGVVFAEQTGDLISTNHGAGLRTSDTRVA